MVGFELILLLIHLHRLYEKNKSWGLNEDGVETQICTRRTGVIACEYIFLLKIHNALFAEGPPGAQSRTPGGPWVTLRGAFSFQSLNDDMKRRGRGAA